MTLDVKDVEKVEVTTIHSLDKDDEFESNLREPPNGGYGWLVVLGCFCAMFATQGSAYSWGVYLEHYNKDVYPGQMTNLTWIGSLWYALTNITGPFHSYLCVKVGYKWMLGAACILSGFSMMMASISTSIWHLYLTQGALSGIASSLAWFPAIAGPQQWFSSRRGLAVGLGIAGSGIGGLVLTNVIRASIDSFGYRWSLRIVGFMQMALLGISFFTVKQLNPVPRGVKVPNVPLIDVSAFKRRIFWVLCGVHFFGNFAFYSPSSFVPSYATKLGLSPIISTNLPGVMSGLMVVGKIGNGLLSDHVGRANITFMCTAMCGVLCLGVFYTAETEASLWAFAVLFGIFGGGYVSLVCSVTVDCIGLDLVESATGWLYFMWLPGGLLSQPIFAVIIENDGGEYGGAIIFAGTLFLFCGLLAGILRFMRSGPNLFVKV